MEISSSTDWNIGNKFLPDTFVNMDINKKHKMLHYYQSEMRKGAHSRSKKILNLWQNIEVAKLG